MRPAVVGAVSFVSMIVILCLTTGPVSPSDMASAAVSLPGLMVLPWSLVVGWAVSHGGRSVQRRAGLASAVVSFVGLLVLVETMDAPSGGVLDAAALIATPGWPMAMLAGLPLRDSLSPEWLDVGWALGTGASPVMWSAILIWSAKRSTFLRTHVLGLA